MRYGIGRACAIAGYVELYQELGLLLDVSIAEEARDNQLRQPRSSEIFESIMKQPIRWLVMDDYRRSVDQDSPLPARYGLNGDTAVRSTLDHKRLFENPDFYSRYGDGVYYCSSIGNDANPAYFNITEDCSIDEYEGRKDDQKAGDSIDFPKNWPDHRPVPWTTPEMHQLLWNPLPIDLPEGNKDILILMAAYYGDLDRYVRLRRPNFVLPKEMLCVIRGIYHNSMFAKWWSLQPWNDETKHY